MESHFYYFSIARLRYPLSPSPNHISEHHTYFCHIPPPNLSVISIISRCAFWFCLLELFVLS